jgi:uncharacterized SAM-binding protein YcdF (DUF218 family)
MVEAASPEAIVVLGCMPLFSAGRLSGALGRRTAAGARSFAETADASLIIASGGRAWAGIVEAESIRAELVLAGVPPAKIVCERCSLSTRDNARYTAAQLRRRGLARVLVVTCGWHLPRAVALFRAQGLEVRGVAAEHEDRATPVVRMYRWGRERVAARLDGVHV